MLWNCECALKRLELLQDLPSRQNKLLVSFESPCSGWKGPGQWAYVGDVYHRWRNKCENIPLSQSVGGKNPWFSRWWYYFIYQNYCWEIFPLVLYSPDPIVYQYLLVKSTISLWFHLIFHKCHVEVGLRQASQAQEDRDHREAWSFSSLTKLLKMVDIWLIYGYCLVNDG